jgi:hypothetical protein
MYVTGTRAEFSLTICNVNNFGTSSILSEQVAYFMSVTLLLPRGSILNILSVTDRMYETEKRIIARYRQELLVQL